MENNHSIPIQSSELLLLEYNSRCSEVGISILSFNKLNTSKHKLCFLNFIFGKYFNVISGSEKINYICKISFLVYIIDVL